MCDLHGVHNPFAQLFAQILLADSSDIVLIHVSPSFALVPQCADFTDSSGRQLEKVNRNEAS
jgi:hypothetical protein